MNRNKLKGVLAVAMTTSVFAGVNSTNMPKLIQDLVGTVNVYAETNGTEISPVTVGTTLNTYQLSADGVLRAKGYNDAGQLGLGYTSSGAKADYTVVPNLPKITKVFPGLRTVYAVAEDDTVYAFGYNYQGMLGVGKTDTNVLTPTVVPGIKGSQIKTIYAPASSCLYAILNDGSLMVSGTNLVGGIGLPKTVSQVNILTKVPGIENVDNVQFEQSTILAQLKDGSYMGFGQNGSGLLGVGNSNNVFGPISLPWLNNKSKVLMGNNAIIAISGDGTMTACGANNRGNLGIGSTNSFEFTPKTASFKLNMTAIKDIKFVGNSWFMLMNDGSVQGWGDSFYGTFGIYGETAGVSSPKAVAGLSNVKDITTLSNTLVAVTNSGDMYTWGYYPYLGYTAPVNFTAYGSSTYKVSATPYKVLTEKVDRVYYDWSIQKPVVIGLDKVGYEWTTTGQLVALPTPVNIATSAVVTAESSYLQADINYAQSLVTALPDGTDKATLQTRINTVQKLVNDNSVKLNVATQAVATAENTLSQTDIANAQALINTLLNNADKTALQNRLNAIPTTVAVVKAESTNLQADVNSATTLVNGLPASTVKTSLQNRLTAVQNIINATASVSLAETQKTESAVITARSLVTALPDSSTKTALNQRLDVVQTIVATPTDKASPNAPVISSTDNNVIVIATDNGSSENTIVNKTDNFESTTFQNTVSGAWARTTTQKYAGSYSLGSSNHTNSSTSSETVTFTVPQGSTGTLAFKYLVSSETNYDWLTITLNGSQIVRVSGVGSWQSYSKSLTAGTYTLTFSYSKDSSGNSNLDTAFIDDLSVNYGGVVNHLPSGIQKIEYQVNGGQWTEYTGAFTPNATGQVSITARAYDYAGNVSPISAQTVTIKNNNLQIATQKLDDIDTLIGDLSTQYKIDQVKSLIEEVQGLVDTLSDGDAKTALQNRINTDTTTVQTGQDIFDATKKVTQSESSVIDLTTQIKIDSAKTALDEAKTLVSALPNGSSKTDLQERLNSVQAKIVEGQAVLDVKAIDNSSIALVGSSTISQSDIDGLKASYTSVLSEINSLPASATKDSLSAKLKKVQNRIYLAQATYDTQKAEESTKVWGTDNSQLTQANIDKAQALLDLALREVNELSSDPTAIIDGSNSGSISVTVLPTKGSLTQRLETAQESIRLAQATLNTQKAEFVANTLMSYLTQSAIDSVQSLYDEAISSVTDLSEGSAKDDLVLRLGDVQEKLIVAQATLNTQKLENSLDSASISATQASISSLADGATKVELQSQLDVVKAVISSTDEVQVVDLSLDNYTAVLNDTNLSASNMAQITSLSTQIVNLETQTDTALAKLNKIPVSKSAKVNERVAKLKAKLMEVKGYCGSIKTILNDATNNYRQGNGNADFRVKISRNATVDLSTTYAKEIATALQDTTDLSWVSFNTSIATVTDDGVMRTLSNGIAKIAVYNESGVFYMYFVVSGK